MSSLFRRGSLGGRLLSGTLIWVLLTLALAWWGLSALFSAHLHRQFEAELANHLNQLAAQLAFDADGSPTIKTTMSDPRFVRPRSGLYWQVDPIPDEHNTATPGVLRSRSLWDEVLRVPVDALADGELHVHSLLTAEGDRLRMVERVVIPADVPDMTFRLIVAAKEGFISEPVAQVRLMLALSLGVLLLGLLGAVVLQLRFALKPLSRLKNELDALRKGSVSTLSDTYPEEIQPLVSAFNKILDRNSDIVQRARTQAGNLAHAVKTPLTVMANAAECEDSPFALMVREQLGSARAQIDHHLARARAAAAVQLPGQQTRVEPVVDSLLRVMQKVHVDRQLNISALALKQRFLFRGEKQDLMEMLGNLVDNACKWAKHTVQVSVAGHDETLTVVVDDDGPGLPPERREQALMRGIRLDERPVGSGLGLAIVRELAQLYGGDVMLSESPLGGLRVSLSLPAVVT